MKRRIFVASAVLAALLYALNAPLSKLLLAEVPPNMMAALLYLGAGFGMACVGVMRRSPHEERLDRSDAPYVLAMVLLDIAAPLLLMAGLAQVPAASVSLLNNFEIVATSLIAFLFFRERIPRRLAVGIVVVCAACMVLSFDGTQGLLSWGALLVMGATVCWGVENNCTNRLSGKDPLQVVVVKGLGSGAGALAVAFAAGDALPPFVHAVSALMLGFVAFGLSIFFYVYAQRGLGAARTSAYYALSPFMGVVLAWALVGEVPDGRFACALVLMAAGVWLITPRESEESPA